MEILNKIREMQRFSDAIRAEEKRIGLVPTMGYLHEGHLSLIQLAVQKADLAVVSVFVNPTQFGPTEDFETYPRDFDRDLGRIEKAGGTVVFAPSVEEMYPSQCCTYVEVEELTSGLCGPFRPGHFRGVTTVVAKLFNAVKPHLAVFGQKDAQQALVIKRMARDLNMDVEIVVGPTVRERDGLAMSSRNVHLTPEERRNAPVLYESLKRAEGMIRDGERRVTRITSAMREKIDARLKAEIDYISIVDAEQLQPLEEVKGEILIALAARVSKVRLIDNIMLSVCSPIT